MGRRNSALLTLLAAALLLPAPQALADDLVAGDAGYYTLQDGEGQLLTQVGGVIAVDDEYITADNRRYRVSLVDDGARRAVAQWVEDVTLPAGRRAALGTQDRPLLHPQRRKLCPLLRHRKRR